MQWHLAADSKSIKCMYGLQHGANCKYACIYCLQDKTKPTIVTQAQATTSMTRRSSSWNGGLFSSSVYEKPIVGAQTLTRWKPIFPIPLNRVHICTLHAMNRIVEKILHLHFMFIWTIRDKTIQIAEINDM